MYDETKRKWYCKFFKTDLEEFIKLPLVKVSVIEMLYLIRLFFILYVRKNLLGKILFFIDKKFIIKIKNWLK